MEKDYQSSSEYSSETQERINKLKTLEASGFVLYPEKFDKNSDISDIVRLSNNGEFNMMEMSDVDGIAENRFNLAGRLMSFRSHGKLSFATLKDSSGTIQLAFKNGSVSVNSGRLMSDSFDIDGTEVSGYEFSKKYIDMGDIIGVKGNVFLSKKGELTLFVKEVQILTKTLNPLPEKYHGLKDMDIRYRKRYMDALLTDGVKETMERKSLYTKAIRDFMGIKGFMEVETPVLENTTGGADARPFSTRHNAFNMEVFLRISAGELWQKRLMVAGFEKTFELGRIFRNEGISPEHAQDYSQMEVYWAYADYKMMMNLVKELYLKIVDNVYGKRVFKIRGFEVDFDKEWEVIDYQEVIKDKLGIDIFKSTEEEMIAKLNELGAHFEAGNRPRLVDYLWKHIRKSISGPAFLINEPKFTSPLAKADVNDPEITHRFHVILAGSEVGNGYSELNDPLDQKERFEQQQALRDAGDDEAQMADWEFVEALMHGMPPTAGFGVSERLFAFLEDKSIREIQLFPLMKPNK